MCFTKTIATVRKSTISDGLCGFSKNSMFELMSFFFFVCFYVLNFSMWINSYFDI